MNEKKNVSCEFCERPLNDWQGNVMVSNQFYPKVPMFFVMCKSCTGIIDRSDFALNQPHSWHNMWELGNFVDHMLEDHLMPYVLEDNFNEWSNEATMKFIKFMRYALNYRASLDA